MDFVRISVFALHRQLVQFRNDYVRIIGLILFACYADSKLLGKDYA